MRPTDTIHRGFRLVLLALGLLGISAGFVKAQPSFTKSFSPATIGPGSTSTLTFTISNESGTPVADLAFTDILPAGVTIAAPAQAATTCTDAVLAAPDGGSTITLSGGRLGAGTSCTATVDVTSHTPGTHTNVSGDLTSSLGNSGPATADLTVDSARPGFTKRFAPASISLGGTSTLTLTIDHSSGAVSAFNLAFTDNLPAGMTVATPSNASTTCTGGVLTAAAGTSVVSLFNGSVSAGATCTISVDVTTASAGTFANATGGLASTLGTSGKASASLTVTLGFLNKTFTDDPTPPGGTVTLRFTLTNFDRSSPATDITFTDDLDAALSGLVALGLPANDVCGAGSQLAGTSLLALTGGTLAPGASCAFDVTLQVPAGAAPGTYPNTTSTVTATLDSGGRGGTQTFDPATDDLVIAPAPALAKTFTDDPAPAGGTVTLAFTVTNTSPTANATALAFTDDLSTALPGLVALGLPANDVCGAGSQLAGTSLLTLTGGTLAPGASCTFDVTLQVPADALPGPHTNTTSAVTGTVDGAALTGNTATDDLVVFAAPRLTKSFAENPVLPGSTVTLEFSLAYTENAPGGTTGITFTDDLDAALSGLVAVGLPANDVCGAGSQLAGTSVLTLTGGSLDVNDTCTFSVLLQVPEAANPGTYSNTTSIVSATMLGTPVTSPAATAELAIASLAFTKAFTDDPVAPGGTVTLEFSLTNLTTSAAATGITFTDDLDAVLSGLVAVGLPANDVCGAGSQLAGTNLLIFSGGTLAPGASCTFSVTLQVPAGAGQGEYVNATSPVVATVGGAPVELGTAVDILLVTSPLALTKTFTDDPVAPGSTVTLEFTLTNTSASDAATDLAFTDDLDAALSGLVAVGLPDSDVCGAGSQLSGTGLLTLTGGSLAAGVSCTFSVTLQVPAAVEAGAYTNTTSTVTGTLGGAEASADPAVDDLVVDDQVVVLRATKADAFDDPDGNGKAPPGSVLTYTVVVRNDGERGAEGVVFTDTPGLHTTLVAGSVTTTQGTVTTGNAEGDTAVGVDLGPLAGGDGERSGTAATITFQVVVVDPLPLDVETVANQGFVTAPAFQGGAPLPSDDPGTEAPADPTRTPIDQSADLRLTKVADDALPDYGAPVTFTLTLTNDGPLAAEAVVADVLPKGLVYTGHVAGTGHYDPAEGTWTTGLVAAGASVTLDLSATVTTTDSVTNTAEVVSASREDPDSIPGDGEGDDFAEATVTPVTVDLALDKVLVAVDEAPDGTIEGTFVVTVTNHGPFEATGVTVSDPVAPGAERLGVTVTRGTYDAQSSRWAVGVLPVGETETLQMTLRGDAHTTIFNVASVTGDQMDLLPRNNRAGVRMSRALPDPARFRADLSLQKTVSDANPGPGATVVYTLRVTNAGPHGTSHVLVEDVLPDGVTFVAADPAAAYDASTGLWTVGTLADGRTAELRLTVTVDGSNSIENVAEVVASALPDADSTPDNGDEDEDDWSSVALTVSSAAGASAPSVVDPPGDDRATATDEEASGIPTTYALLANFPNPFTNETVIPFGLPEPGPVRLSVFDLLGREVSVLVDGVREAGYHRVTWEAGDQPAGLYLVRLTAGTATVTRRLTLLK